MQKCSVYHTGIALCAEGVIKDNRVYIYGKDNKLYFPESLDWLMPLECDGAMTQFLVNGKWGFADILTGEIIIGPIWDYAGPFYGLYAHVALCTKVEDFGNGDAIINGGKHGYIDYNGEVIIPLVYNDAEDLTYNQSNFVVSKKGKWGVVGIQNNRLIPLIWDSLEIHSEFILAETREPCEPYLTKEAKILNQALGIPPEEISVETMSNYISKYSIYDREYNLIISDLDEKPALYKNHFIIKRKRKYGVLSREGKIINDINLYKKDAIKMIRAIDD